MLCPEEYGDVVHWAEGLLASYIPEFVPEYDCGNEIDIRSRREIEEETSMIYPNPVSNNLHINLGKSTSSTISLYDINGNKLRSINADSTETIIDVSAFNSGIYLLEIKSYGQPAEMHKIVIQN